MASLKGTVIITGANGGLGSAFASAFSSSTQGQSYYGIYTVRKPTTAFDLGAVLKKAPSTHQSEVLTLNLSSLEAVRATAENINTRVANGTIPPIRAIILNAAFQDANPKTLTPQSYTQEGFESAFGINYLAHFLLVLLLLKSVDKEHGRVVVVSSWTHDPYDGRNDGIAIFKGDEFKVMFKDPESLAKGITYTDDGYKAGMRRYGMSKLLMVMFMYELQRRLTSDPQLSKIAVLGLDPGAMGATGLTKTSPPLIRFLTGWVIWAVQGLSVRFSPNGMLRPTWKSANDLMLACFNVDTSNKPVYLGGSAVALSSKESQDVEKQKRLWVDSVKFVGLVDGDTQLKNWQ